MGDEVKVTFSVELPKNYVLVNPVTGERRCVAAGWGVGLRDYLLRKRWIWVNRWAFPEEEAETGTHQTPTA